VIAAVRFGVVTPSRPAKEGCRSQNVRRGIVSGPAIVYKPGMHGGQRACRWKFTTTISLLLLAGMAVAQKEDSADSAPETPLVKKSFEQLSERNVTRTGERALNIKGVTWEHSETEHFIFHTETGFLVPQLANAAEDSTNPSRPISASRRTRSTASRTSTSSRRRGMADVRAQVNLEEWTGASATGGNCSCKPGRTSSSKARPAA